MVAYRDLPAAARTSRCERRSWRARDGAVHEPRSILASLMQGRAAQLDVPQAIAAIRDAGAVCW